MRGKRHPRHAKQNKACKKSVKVAVGGNYTLKPQVLPSYAHDKTVVFTSSNPNVAKVDDNGVVTGVKNGSCKIKCSTVNGKTQVVKVSVAKVPLKGISAKSPALILNINQNASMPINLSPSPQYACVESIKYTSSDTSIATVDEFGVVTAQATGTCKILCQSAKNKKIKCVIDITVLKLNGELPLSGITVGINPGHQVTGDFRKLPVAPGSSRKRYAVGVGTTGAKTKIPEYTTNLQIAFKLKNKLEALGAKVVLTRESNDVNITNIQRANMLNNAGCNVALQIHCNSSEYKNVQGYELYVKPKGAAASESYYIAQCMCPEISKSTGAINRGIIVSDNYMSLNYSTVPSILVECGYSSNPQEDVNLNTPHYQELFVDGVINGLIRAFVGK